VRSATSSTTGGGIGAPPLYVRRSDERSCAAAASSQPVAMYAVIVTVTPSCSVSLVATTGPEVVREDERRAGGERQADVAAQARHMVERCDAEHAVLAPRPASRDIGAAPLGGPVVTDIPSREASRWTAAPAVGKGAPGRRRDWLLRQSRRTIADAILRRRQQPGRGGRQHLAQAMFSFERYQEERMSNAQR